MTTMENTQCKPLPTANFHRLRFLSVIGGFLDGQTFEFSAGLNCLIGARGTGKTTALELIRYAAQKKLPLDFISWHHFSAYSKNILTAKKTYEAALRDAGYEWNPEFVVSEWNIIGKYRSTPMAAALMADALLAFREAGVDIQTVSAWVDFNADAGPEGYGLITQKGEKRPVFYVHQFFDRLARDSLGMAVIKEQLENQIEGSRCIIISKESDGRYEMILWEIGYEPPTAAAIEYLLNNGLTQANLEAYGTAMAVEEAIRTGRARDENHQSKFEAAQQIYNDFPQRGQLYMQFPDADQIEVLSAKSVKSTFTDDKQIEVDQNKLFCPLEKFEVILLKLQIR